MEYKVFYSWQSDTPNPTNRGFIQAALEGAIQDLKQDAELKVEPSIDRDTAGVPGAPDIGQTIFAKISEAAALVCDVTIIHEPDSKGRRAPNPNVLIELGYGLRALGPARIVLVMNTAFGGPDLLPFDLKQKRVVTYECVPGSGNGPAKRKELRGKLTVAVKSVLTQHLVAEEARVQQTVLETAVASVDISRPDQGRKVAAYMKWFVGELIKLNPKDLDGEADENLVQAINQTVPLLQGFGELAGTIAAANSGDAARAVHKGFESLLVLYRHPPQAGSYRPTDFDFFKFVGHEAFVIFGAALIRDSRWPILNEMLVTPFMVEMNAGLQALPYAFLADHVALLDSVRNRRLAINNSHRISIQADMLKERHDDTAPLGEILPWREFLETDLILGIRSYVQRATNRTPPWFPRTWVYLGSHQPRFLIASTTPAGAGRLMKVLSADDIGRLREQIAEALKDINARISQSSMFGDGIDFDTNTIAQPLMT